MPRQTAGADKILELQSAKEILAEVFGVDISDVDEMIQNRFTEADSAKRQLLRKKDCGLPNSHFRGEQK